MLTINHWRASLVPAAAVIPAPIAYTNVVAVKKLVVGFQFDVWFSTEGPMSDFFDTTLRALDCGVSG